jgi:hypothetical protein
VRAQEAQVEVYAGAGKGGALGVVVARLGRGHHVEEFALHVYDTEVATYARLQQPGLSVLGARPLVEAGDRRFAQMEHALRDGADVERPVEGRGGPGDFQDAVAAGIQSGCL